VSSSARGLWHGDDPDTVEKGIIVQVPGLWLHHCGRRLHHKSFQSVEQIITPKGETSCRSGVAAESDGTPKGLPDVLTLIRLPPLGQ
jgi:hypothetical protein